jgi:GGDEF domain-containing protein
MNEPTDPAARLRHCQDLLAARELELRHLRETIDAFLPLDIDTGLLNRNGLIEAIRRCTLWWERRREHFAVLAVHLPGIERSDNGDRASMAGHFAATIAASLRSVDEAGRLDNATFAVVLRDFHREGVNVVSERIGNALRVAAEEYLGTGFEPQIGLCLVASREPYVPSHYLDAAVAAAKQAGGQPQVIEA